MIQNSWVFGIAEQSLITPSANRFVRSFKSSMIFRTWSFAFVLRIRHFTLRTSTFEPLYLRTSSFVLRPSYFVLRTSSFALRPSHFSTAGSPFHHAFAWCPNYSRSYENHSGTGISWPALRRPRCHDPELRWHKENRSWSLDIL